MRASRVALWLGACAVICVSTARAEDEDDRYYRKAKPALQQKLRSKKSGDRVEALHMLSEYGLVDAAKLVLTIGFKDQAEEVNREAFSTLLEYRDNQKICDHLQTSLSKESKRKSGSESCGPLVAVLLSSKLPEVADKAIEFVDKTLAHAKDGLLTLVMMADMLGDRGQPTDFLALSKLTESKTFAAEFGFRRAVVDALCRTQLVEAVDLLVKLVPKIEGEAQADVIDHLSDVTEQRFGTDGKAWAKWWEENKDEFQFPARRPAPFRSIARGDSSSYYGIPVYAQHAVFVIDTSGSMAGPRLEAAKRELRTAVNGLRATVQFGIVQFNSRASVWQKKLVPATAANKAAAMAYIEQLQARGMTASYDALELAFGFDAEAIYFLTDGQPHGGKIVNPVEIVAAISKGNRHRRESIHTIGIGVGPAGSLFDTFLTRLAEQNQGVYQRVEQ